MKRSFRFGALAMALLMAVLLMPTLSYADEGGIEGMPEELTIFCGMDGWLAKAGVDMHASEAYNEMERVTGTKINWINPTSAAVNEQFNLMIVSGDLPDVLKRGF